MPAQHRRRHGANALPNAAAPGNLAELAIFFTERCVILRNVIGTAMLAAALSGAAPAQGAANGDVPRTNYITTMDQQFGQMDADKNGKVTRAEMKAAGVVK